MDPRPQLSMADMGMHEDMASMPAMARAPPRCDGNPGVDMRVSAPDARPAWGPTHDDEEIWNSVSFVHQWPHMRPEEYRAMTSVAGSDEPEGGKDEHGHDHVHEHSHAHDQARDT